MPRTSKKYYPKSSKSTSDSGRAFDSLFNSSKYSDVTIYLGKSKIPFPAHRLVLGTRCPYLDDILQSGLKEDITTEISFTKDNSHALWRVLQYIYTGDYSDEPSETLDSEDDDLELLKHPRIFALSGIFRIDDLKELSCNKFEDQLEQHWISDTFPHCIREIYSTSNNTDIRKIVVDAVASHSQDLVEKRSFQDLIREVGDFAVDLVLKMAEGSGRY
ncbi:hypothetical protein Egran_03144 [Elaphomyces granulatus]|uniref:BTB domain-containing protein n=1 Tax=Elaphomyces granulatus TaxID=519963 RepID=A0A232LY56_9EURO|nr:hypothetical protein Egran_03144 [Elaphomyces granulatus]